VVLLLYSFVVWGWKIVQCLFMRLVPALEIQPSLVLPAMCFHIKVVCIFGGSSESAVENATIPHSQLAKRWNALSLSSRAG